jgi:multiple antibiotic resistance protein
VNLKFFGEVYVTLLVIVDPPGMVPVFLALTGTMQPKARIKAGTQAVLLALGVIVGFAVAGQTLLDYLHVQLPALQGAGGLLLVLIGTPLLAGPGAIVATMLFVRRADGFADYTLIGIAILLVMLTVWLVLRFSGVIVALLRPAGIEVLTRIAGLLLAAIAVQLIADAIDSFVKLYTASP